MRPNVLLINVDHWPGSLLGSAGHPCIQTPTLDQLAKDGTRFSRAYSECPVCIPARRTLLTGMSPRSHGDRSFQVTLPMPPAPTVAGALRESGYQTYAVGKLHIYPPRARAGFDDVLLCEEGRPQFGAVDDYEIFLGDEGFAGQQFLHGMSNNDYVSRPWHLPESCHVTNWTTRQMARTIQRRDPTRPGFWYLSYTHPHPPLAPLPCYLDMYRDVDPGEPYRGDWADERRIMPGQMNQRLIDMEDCTPQQVRSARRAFYALCTHIDHQLRVVLGTLREEGLLDNTLILFLSDHGDMLGNHGLWAKRLFYEDSAQIPMILVPPKDWGRAGGQVDTRLAGLQDIMPTILEATETPVPDNVDGHSLLGESQREWLYGEYGEGAEATRMIRTSQHKLIYYPSGNRQQLFDLDRDPRELQDLAADPSSAAVRSELVSRLIDESYGDDQAWIRDGALVGLDTQPAAGRGHRHLSLQRGSHWPLPPNM